MAKVVVTPEAQQQFQELPVAIRNRLEKIFARFKQWPVVSGAKALSDKLAGHYRIRPATIVFNSALNADQRLIL